MYFKTRPIYKNIETKRNLKNVNILEFFKYFKNLNYI